jgi:hypothetical protein
MSQSNHSEGDTDHHRLRRRLSSICIDRGDWIPECNDGLNLLIVVAGTSYLCTGDDVCMELE